MEYESISRVFTGWSYNEIKEMPKREREYWYKAAQDVRRAPATVLGAPEVS